MGSIARYWKDPRKFMPERFLGDWPKDAFFAFSQGISRFVIIIVVMTQWTHCRRPRLSGTTVRAVYSVSRAKSSDKVSRFFETEGIAIMTMLVSRYKIEIKQEPEFAGETFEERYARITAFDQGLTTR